MLDTFSFPLQFCGLNAVEQSVAARVGVTEGYITRKASGQKVSKVSRYYIELHWMLHLMLHWILLGGAVAESLGLQTFRSFMYLMIQMSAV